MGTPDQTPVRNFRVELAASAERARQIGLGIHHTPDLSVRERIAASLERTSTSQLPEVQEIVTMGK